MDLPQSKKNTKVCMFVRMNFDGEHDAGRNNLRDLSKAPRSQLHKSQFGLSGLTLDLKGGLY